jgi:DNA-binding transcriptional LysR family regulator
MGGGGPARQQVQRSIICYKTMQMSELPEISELQTFVRTVEAGSISRAALELKVPRPTVSRRLERLEQKLGVRLLHRTTRVMALSDAGGALFQRARAVLAAVQDAQTSVQRSDGAVRGLLRVSIPPFQGTQFGAMLSGFLAAYPEVRVELEASTRHVDLAAGGFDVAIRASSELAPGLIARKLATTRLVAVAAPSYLERAGRPGRVTELKGHACLVGFDRGEFPLSAWPLRRGGRIRIEPRFASNEIMTLRELAVAGHGVALLPLPLVHDELTAGSLEALFPERVGAEVTIAVVYAARELVPPAVKAFVEATVRWASREPALRQEMPRCPERKAKKRGRGAGLLVEGAADFLGEGAVEDLAPLGVEGGSVARDGGDGGVHLAMEAQQELAGFQVVEGDAGVVGLALDGLGKGALGRLGEALGDLVDDDEEELGLPEQVGHDRQVVGEGRVDIHLVAAEDQGIACAVAGGLDAADPGVAEHAEAVVGEAQVEGLTGDGADVGLVAEVALGALLADAAGLALVLGEVRGAEQAGGEGVAEGLAGSGADLLGGTGVFVGDPEVDAGGTRQGEIRALALEGGGDEVRLEGAPGELGGPFLGAVAEGEEGPPVVSGDGALLGQDAGAEGVVLVLGLLPVEDGHRDDGDEAPEPELAAGRGENAGSAEFAGFRDGGESPGGARFFLGHRGECTKRTSRRRRSAAAGSWQGPWLTTSFRRSCRP